MRPYLFQARQYGSTQAATQLQFFCTAAQLFLREALPAQLPDALLLEANPIKKTLIINLIFLRIHSDMETCVLVTQSCDPIELGWIRTVAGRVGITGTPLLGVATAPLVGVDGAPLLVRGIHGIGIPSFMHHDINRSR